MKTTNNDPNFSIVMPGGCNASCDFCFNTKDVEFPTLRKTAYISNLIETLTNLDKKFYQISITGGEPLLSPYFDLVFEILPDFRDKYTNILLTTNGTGLLEKIDQVSVAVDHINISRHHYDESKNKSIFKGTYDLPDSKLSVIIDEYGKRGIDISVNCVITDLTSREFIEAYIAWARNMGFEAVRFRKENGTLDKTPVELTFNDYRVLWEGSCPVCRTTLQRILGTKVYWKSSLLEPTDIIPSDEVFEVVFQPDGICYLDWTGKRPMSPIKSSPSEKTLNAILKKYSSPMIEQRSNTNLSSNVSGYSGCEIHRIPSRNSCGGSSSSSRC